MPILLFGSATAGGGIAGGHYIRKKGFPGMARQLKMLMVALPLTIITFILSYFSGLLLGSWTHSYMYGVYSQEKEVSVRGPGKA